MKALAIITVFCFFANVSGAQSTNIFKRNPVQEYKLKKLMQDTLKLILPVSPETTRHARSEPGVIRLQLEANYLGETEKGDQKYAMSTDRMTCLTPGKTFHASMPVVAVEKYLQLPLPKVGEETKNTDVKDKNAR